MGRLKKVCLGFLTDKKEKERKPAEAGSLMVRKRNKTRKKQSLKKV